MVLKYTFRSNIQLIISAYIIFLLIMFGGIVWFNYERFFIIGFSIAYLINILAGVYLHVEYYKANRHIEYVIYNDRITVLNKGKRTTYLVEELQKIIVYMPPAVYKKSSLTAWAIEEFYYARIITKNGEELILTCLLTSKLENALMQLKEVEYIRRKEIFCTLLLKYRA